MQQSVFSLFTRKEVEALAKTSGFSARSHRGIPALEFALCCALAATTEAKRGFATVWRLLLSVAGVKVARSAVTQRFDAGSAKLLERLFLQAVERLPTPAHPELLGKLTEFRQVLAHDGSVVMLAPLLSKLFPATRTNAVKAAAKVHATTDLVHRRLTKVVITGERDGELAVAKAEPIEPNTLHINDLGYFAYDHFAAIKKADAHLLSRLKENANPVLVRARHGVVAPVSSIGKKLNDLAFCRTKDTFDLDATFETKKGTVELRVVGRFNPETQKYHCYVTTLPPERFDVLELVNLYCLRWVIELVFKLLKSSCHLDHVATSNPDAMRTHLYASLLASVLLTAVTAAAAEATKIPPSLISPLVVGIAAPLLAVPLALLWLKRNVTADELADVILRTIATGCIDQNPARTRRKWGILS